MTGRPMDAAGVLALQRSAGNAAVTQSLEAQGDDHDHALPVQRVLRNDRRDYGTAPRQLMRPNNQDQQRLEAAFPRDQNNDFQQFPDPVVFGRDLSGQVNAHLPRQGSAGAGPPNVGYGEEAAPWVQAINPPRQYDAYRRNCIDAVRSFLASWSGNPTVAVGVVGTTDQHVEEDGNDRTASWLATRWRYTDDETPAGQPTMDAWSRVAARLERTGHGAASVVVFQRAETGLVHAVCGVNHLGSIVWVDPQQGRISLTGAMYNGTAFMTITLSPQFTPVDEPAPHPTALTLD